MFVIVVVEYQLHCTGFASLVLCFMISYMYLVWKSQCIPNSQFSLGREGDTWLCETNSCFIEREIRIWCTLYSSCYSYVKFYCNGIQHHFQIGVPVSLLAYITPYIHFKHKTVSDMNYCSETWYCDDYFALTAMKSQTNQYIVEFDFTYEQYGKCINLP